ncbi:hypothetical protein [Shewanella gaetbuli]|nr:hypothetical protein [Shewanella gaetbuli]
MQFVMRRAPITLPIAMLAGLGGVLTLPYSNNLMAQDTRLPDIV